MKRETNERILFFFTAWNAFGWEGGGLYRPFTRIRQFAVVFVFKSLLAFCLF